MPNKLEEKRKQLRKRIDEGDYKSKIKEFTKGKAFKVLLVLLVVVAGLVGWHYYKTYETYDSYDVKDTIKIKSGENTEIKAFGDFICMYSRNGISYISDHDTVWNESHEMKNPMVDVCDDYLALCDKNTNNIFIYNKSGQQGSVTTSYPVVKMEVAKQGVVAALLRDQDVNYIEVIDKDGNLLVSHKTLLAENGYPINFTMSDDGEQMIVSYVQIQNGTISNKLLVYDFGDAGKDKNNRVLKEFKEFKDQVVPTLARMDSDRVWAVGEHTLSTISLGSSPKIKDSIKIKDEIYQVFYNDDYMGFVFETEDEKRPFRIKVYNKSLKMVLDTYTDLNYSEVMVAGKNVLLYNSTNAKIISMKGVKKFDYKFKKPITKIVPLNDEEYIITRKNKLMKVDLD